MTTPISPSTASRMTEAAAAVTLPPFLTDPLRIDPDRDNRLIVRHAQRMATTPPLPYAATPGPDQLR